MQDAATQYDRFQLIVNGPALFNAVVTGLELDVFGHLATHPDSGPAELAKATGLGAHQVRVLMLALCASGLVERADGGYRNSALAADLLATDRPDGWRDILLGWQRIYYPAFAHTTEALRAGTNLALKDHAGTEPTLYQRLAHNRPLEAVLHRSMSAFTRASLPALVGNPALATVRHLLDIGGGDGATARALLDRYPDLEVTVVDLPTVTELTGPADRLRTHPADIFADPFPPGADAILFSHVLEVFSAEQIQVLLGKAHDALGPGGQVLVYGFNAPDEENGGVLAARLSLYLNVLATGRGMAYPMRDYATLLRRAGFNQIETFPGLPYEHGLLIGTRTRTPHKNAPQAPTSCGNPPTGRHDPSDTGCTN